MNVGPVLILGLQVEVEMIRFENIHECRAGSDSWFRGRSRNDTILVMTTSIFINIGGGSDSRLRVEMIRFENIHECRAGSDSRIFLNVGGGFDSRFRGRSRDDTTREYL